MRHQDVLCDPLQGGCGTLSCAHAGCYEEAHFPCSCEQVKAWTKMAGDRSDDSLVEFATRALVMLEGREGNPL